MNPDWLVSSSRSSGATPISRLISARSNHRVGQLKAEVKLCFVLAVSNKYSDTNNADVTRLPSAPSVGCAYISTASSHQQRWWGWQTAQARTEEDWQYDASYPFLLLHCGARMRRDLYTWLATENEYTYRFGMSVRVHACALYSLDSTSA